MSLSAIYIFGFVIASLAGLFWYLRRNYSASKEPLRAILDLAAIPPLRQALPDLILEVARARRLSHTLALVIVRAEFVFGNIKQTEQGVSYLRKSPAALAKDRQLDLQQFSDCSRAFRDLLREVDCVAFDSVQDQFIVILPGSTRTQAIETINRICKQLGPDIANRLIIGIAEYPNDGLFLEDLIEHGIEQVKDGDQSRELKIEARA